MIIQCRHLSKYYGAKEIFGDINLALHRGEKVALIGPNGGGKSTLIKIIAGLDQDYGGHLDRAEALRSFYLPQSLDSPGNPSLKQVLLADEEETLALKDRLAYLEDKLTDSRALSEYGELLSRYEELGGFTLEARVKEVTERFLWGIDALDIPFRELSGGEKTRIFLARAFLGKCELLLLDEPTNHLDLHGIKWLEKVVTGYEGTVLYVSHDREFIDRTAGRVLELEWGHLSSYRGGYTAYRQAKDQKEQTLQDQYEQAKKEEKKVREAARRHKDWFKKAHKDAGQNDFLRARAKKGARAFKALEKRLARIEHNTEKPKTKKGISGLELETGAKKGRYILRAWDVALKRGRQTLIEDLNLQLTREDRVVVIGPNGSGKSTFFEHIATGKKPAAGDLQINPNLSIGYFQQELQHLPPELNPVDYLAREGLSQEDARTLLGVLGLRRDEAIKPFAELSPGQKARVVLAYFIAQRPDLLLLDEPTNYLDIEAREALETALNQYPGTVMAASHDRFFLRKLGTKVVDFSTKKPRVHNGPFTDYENDTAISERELMTAMRRAEITARLGNELSPAEKAFWEAEYRKTLEDSE